MRVALVGSVLCAASLVCAAQTIQVSRENKTIAITTNGEASAVADIAVVDVGYTVYAKDKDTVYVDGSKISNDVVAALKKAGVPDTAIESRSQSLQPLDENDQKRFGLGMRFKLSQNWAVTVDGKSAADVIHVATIAGANDSGNIQWKLRDHKGIEAQAAKEALSHAREIAQRMAEGLNAKLGPLVYASNQTPPRGLAALLSGGVMLQTESAMSAKVLHAGPLVIKPETVTESATVYAVFAIE